MSSNTSEHLAPKLRLLPPARAVIRAENGQVYEILRELAPGGMSDTFLVRRNGAGRTSYTYCLKCMRDDAKKAEFLDEAYITSRLQHHHIVRTFEADADTEGRYFICMEYVDGVNLEHLLRHLARKQRRLPVSLITHIVRQVLHALRYAHELRDELGPLHIVHRDVTPSNVLISREGFVKLTDFGIARFRKKARHTTAGHIKGKLLYMSPEHFSPAREFDARTDLFSLGATWFEMLTGGGQPYGKGDDHGVLLDALYHGRINPLHELAPDLDPAMGELVLSMLQPNRENRPPSSRKVLEALCAFPSAPDDGDRLAAEVESYLDDQRMRAPVKFDLSVQKAQALMEGHETAPGLHAVSDEELESARTSSAEVEVSSAGVYTESRPSAAQPPPLPAPASGIPGGHRIRRGLLAIGLAGTGASIALTASLAAYRAPAPTQTQQQPAIASPAAPQPERPMSASTQPPARAPEGPAAPAATVAATAEPSTASSSAADAQQRTERARTRAPAARPKPGTVVVLVRAPKAVVWINGTLQPARRPLTVQLPPGRYRIAASEDERVPPRVHTDVLVTSGKTIEINLELPGPL